MLFDIPVPSTLPAFLVASFLIELTPGPNMGYLAVVSLSQGRRAGFAVVAGVASGLLCLGFAGAWGVSAVLQHNEFLYEALRYAGVAFLLYLAWEGWRGASDGAVPRGDGSNFLRGYLNNVLNPKAALFYVAVLPDFVVKGADILPQTLILTIGYVAVATLIHALVVLAAGAFHRFAADPTREIVVRRFLSLTLAAFAIWFGWSAAP